MSLRSQKISAVALDLVREGIIPQEELDRMQALNDSEKDLKALIIEKKYVTESQFNERLARKAGVGTFSFKDFAPDIKILSAMQPGQALRWHIIPILENRGRLTVATADPFDLGMLDEARSELGRDIDCLLASEKEVENALETFYGGESCEFIPGKKPPPKVPELVTAPVSAPAKQIPQAPVERAQKGSEIVSVIDEIFLQAVRERASDIHLEPTREGLKVRFRIDGVLEHYKTYPPAMQAALLSRVKIMGGMDVAEQRIPQDGRTTLNIEAKDLDVRIASYPTMFGEAAALRLLSKNLITLEALGFSLRDREIFEKLINKPHGIFLVTGPTGSGKTTSLYAALQRIDRHKRHVLSVEDPVENEIDGVGQTQINAKAGLTFPAALRSMLRQDPDVIMIGEIRDQETADIALRAAMTGHLVISTLHTNDAIGAIGRLSDLGIETFLVSSTLTGIIAQRLARKICQLCKEEVPVTAEQIRSLGPKADKLRAYRGKGCKECGNRGYSGRIGIYEVVYIDEEMRVLIANKAPEVRMREKASSAGTLTMCEDGIEKIRQGLTTVEEVLKACGEQ